MNPEEYDKMFAKENTYWWYLGRRDILESLIVTYGLVALGSRVLDVGCGTGLILQTLHKYAEPIGLDFSPLSLDYCQQRGLKRLIRGNVKNLPVKSESLDCVIALDILEHVDDDERMLEEIMRTLKPGGWLVLTVPAHPSLWSDHDRALHHCRRYTRRLFRDRIRGAGFEIVKLSYAVAFLCVPIFIYRFVQKLLLRPSPNPRSHVFPLPRPINGFFEFLLRVEGKYLRRGNLPFGVTLLSILRKPVSRPSQRVKR